MGLDVTYILHEAPIQLHVMKKRPSYEAPTANSVKVDTLSY